MELADGSLLIFPTSTGPEYHSAMALCLVIGYLRQAAAAADA